APSARLRGGRCGLGASLHVPDGPRVGASPLLAAGGPAPAPAPRLFPRTRVHPLSRRPGGRSGHRSLQRAPAAVGPRLSAQRFDVAEFAGRAREARGPSQPIGQGSDPSRQRCRAIRSGASVMTYDLVIRGGTVVDGSGLPRYRGDVAVTNGTIARIGRNIRDSGGEEIDARDAVVSPEFTDGNPHMDAQSHGTRSGPAPAGTA